ncbi:50S ribosomal protein L10 [Candidatus Micrarchaeota archaeon]|nr:50S ribosomal protein L10 [Candidatus Micrarchaeota archaeon]MBU1681774.1 50S ribosomal protein L10 [Candidatus Micrarchaeota archaeon]
MDYVIDTNRKTIQEKIKEVDSYVKEMKNYKTVALLNLKKLPDSLLQSLRKKIKDEGGKVVILRKPVISRVLASNKKLAGHVDECKKPVALILTNSSPYELNKFFNQHKKKRAAKVGDVAKADIVVPEGETDLPPGPALSELKAGGVNVQIKGGKIIVSKDSTVAKAGEEITLPKVKALQSLGIMPFEVMASLIFGYDGEYVYSSDILSLGDTIDEDIAESLSEAFNFSMNAGYPTEQNADILLKDAIMQSVNMALNADVYSSSSIEQLLTCAMRQGGALETLEPKEAPKDEPPKEEKAEGSDAPAAEEK